MASKEYGHVCCPNCGMILVFTTEFISNAAFNNTFEPYRKPKQYNSPTQEFEAMSARVRKDVRGNWIHVYKYISFAYRKPTE